MRFFCKLLLFLPTLLFSQVPQGVGYQGVATDANGIELVNQAISIQASVLSSSATGNIEWQEEHSVTTDAFGLFNLTIGQGTTTGNGAQTSFADISWGASTHFLKIEMDVNGGSNYTFMGTNQMMSVPYALYAENANIDYDSISTLLSNDSTFITNIGGGLGGGGCDFQFPDGFDMITAITSNYGLTSTYTVPTNKRLYISSATTSVFINGLSVPVLSGNYILCNPGDVLSHPSNSYVFNGYLADENYFADCGGGSSSSSNNTSSGPIFIDPIQIYQGDFKDPNQLGDLVDSININIDSILGFHVNTLIISSDFTASVTYTQGVNIQLSSWNGNFLTPIFRLYSDNNGQATYNNNEISTVSNQVMIPNNHNTGIISLIPDGGATGVSQGNIKIVGYY
jgi:hypothetical protein